MRPGIRETLVPDENSSPRRPGPPLDGSIWFVSVHLDHTILEVDDAAVAVAFYRDVVGLEYRGTSGPFEVMLVTPDLAIDLHEVGASTSRHLAFAMDRETFDATFERIRQSGITYGDGPGSPDNNRGPGRSSGVHGKTDSVYFHDPSGHILEILTYHRG
jgi:catechol 2,3-dioxygenase-like lactoylglutathione lyase family enzyme